MNDRNDDGPRIIPGTMTQRKFAEGGTVPGAEDSVPHIGGRTFISPAAMAKAGWRIVRETYPWMALRDGQNESILTQREADLYAAIVESQKIAMELFKLNYTELGWKAFREAHKRLRAQEREMLVKIRSLALTLLRDPLAPVTGETIAGEEGDANGSTDGGRARDGG